MDKKEIQMLHESIHAEYRTALAEAQWALAQANAREKVKEARIVELLNLLDLATTPEA